MRSKKQASTDADGYEAHDESWLSGSPRRVALFRPDDQQETHSRTPSRTLNVHSSHTVHSLALIAEPGAYTADSDSARLLPVEHILPLLFSSSDLLDPYVHTSFLSHNTEPLSRSSYDFRRFPSQGHLRKLSFQEPAFLPFSSLSPSFASLMLIFPTWSCSRFLVASPPRASTSPPPLLLPHPVPPSSRPRNSPSQRLLRRVSPSSLPGSVEEARGRAHPWMERTGRRMEGNSRPKMGRRSRPRPTERSLLLLSREGKSMGARERRLWRLQGRRHLNRREMPL
jgi:hypothetical protein